MRQEAESSPEVAAKLEAYLEEDGPCRGLCTLGLVCESVEFVQQRLACITAGAADPAAEAARLIQTPCADNRNGPATSPLQKAAGFGNTAVLAFFLAQPGVDPNAPGTGDHPPLYGASMVGAGV